MTDDSKEQGIHVYGTADPANREPPPQQGLRGENDPAREEQPELTHEAHADGRTFAVQETSGVAFAEASGAAGGSEDAGE